MSRWKDKRDWWQVYAGEGREKHLTKRSSDGFLNRVRNLSKPASILHSVRGCFNRVKYEFKHLFKTLTRKVDGDVHLFYWNGCRMGLTVVGTPHKTVETAHLKSCWLCKSCYDKAVMRCSDIVSRFCPDITDIVFFTKLHYSTTGNRIGGD